jgi:hypothetical protein
MLRKVFLVAAFLSFVLLAANPRPANEAKAMAPEPPGLSLSDQVLAATNLLANGDMDQVKFYWRPTNHFVAGMWYEWFWTGAIPEFIDGGIKTHNQCYPEPPSGKVCVDDMHNSSQGYIRWGGPYVAGIYQPVQVTACSAYQFEAYNRNDDVNYHPKVGIDPTGQVLPPYIPPDGNGLPVNCPPDGYSKCPNPGIESLSELPPHMVWSAESNPPKFTWVPISVTAEALSTTISVWTYVAPENTGSPSRSTFWDYASLVQAPSSKLTTGTLPPNDNSFITGVTSSTTAIRANLSWQTSQPAVTQVLYHWVGNASMTLVPPPVTSVSDFESFTPVDSAASTAHSVRLANLSPTSIYDYAILARRVVGSACQTAVITGRFNTTDALIPVGALPAPSSDIVGPVIKPHDAQSVYVIWQSGQPSYAQVLYHHVVTSTVPATMTNRVYLPIVQSAAGTDSTANYELRTSPEFTATTLHVIEVTGLLTDSQYTAVAVSAWSEGDQDKVAVSGRLSFSTESTSVLRAASVGPNQLVEQLQACLADGKKLDACVNELPR